MQPLISPGNRVQFLDLMYELGAHNVWQVGYIVEELTKCCVNCRIDEDRRSLWISDSKITETTPEWGDSGIYPPIVLDTIIDFENFSEPITTNMNGRRFAYCHILTQLAKRWDISKQYV
jgi:hypothetical protein